MPATGPGCFSGVVRIYTTCRYPHMFCSSFLKICPLTGDRTLGRFAGVGRIQEIITETNT